MINKIKGLLVRYRELILYGFFGVLTTVVNFVTFHISGKILGEERYLISNVVAWLAAVTFAYFTNKLFVFESKSFAPKTLFKELSVFFSSRVFTFVIEEVGMWLLVDGLEFGEMYAPVFGFIISGQMISKVIVGVVVIVINYFATKFITFRKKKKE